MKTASVRELKNQTSALLRHAAVEDVVITSRGRPVARLVGMGERTLTPADKKRMFRVLSRIWKLKPEKGKTWVDNRLHDQVLYGGDKVL
jgi:prevent-host-death family protein